MRTVRDTLLDYAVKEGMGEAAEDVAVLPGLQAATVGAIYDLRLTREIGNVLMVRDAGGGTVDLRTYECTRRQDYASIL
jgi:hypothetical protein